MECDPRKQLDWELSLDSKELASHGWYHGSLDRVSAESLLLKDGSFLVRDSSTQPGHYVLSCKHLGHFLHFVINRVVVQPDTVYEHFQYQLEHEAYDTVPDLVTSYVGSGKPVSHASGAKIQTPSNRTTPILNKNLDSYEVPPEKPVRNQHQIYQASGSDSGNGSGDSIPLESNDSKYSKISIMKLDLERLERLILSTPILEFKYNKPSDLEKFKTELLSSFDNKPLESDTLQTIKLLLRTSGPMILANHLTRVDLKFLLESKSAESDSNPLNKISGLELCLLDHGEQMRMDIIERAECVKFLIVVTILTCQSDVERADVLNDWIQLAIETKTALGNLYGFSVIMHGLCNKQVNKMEGMWNILRQRHTHSAFTFESKLRPSFKNMNECVDSSPPNMTLPHVLPIVMLLNNCDKQFDFGVNSADFGLSAICAHLEAARKYPESIPFYERNAKIAVANSSDEILLDLFRTEFHAKFLWGARGAVSPWIERCSKMSDLLDTMADRYLK